MLEIFFMSKSNFKLGEVSMSGSISDLVDYCRWGKDWSSRAVTLLRSDENGELDLTHDNGAVFKLSIKNGDYVVLSALS